ncbi:MAG: hypothetical protein K6T71_05150 [Candidatus Bipolaricaulota bacterium]|nr:hypothetical protein [Candidatus Bipolaricaulota bacterium]
MKRNYTKSRAMAIVVLTAILAMGLYAPTSVPQQNPEEILIGTVLCFVPGAPVYSLQALLQVYGITPTRVISSEGSVRAYPDFRVETIALGQGRIVIEGLDEARTPGIVEIAVMVENCPNLPAQPSPQNPPPPHAKMVLLSPDPINLCVGETRSVYFEVQVFAGGLLHRDPARILAVNVDVPGIIAVAVANPGWVRVTGLAPGNVILDVSGQSQPLGTSQHIPEGTPAAFVLNPKEGVE